MVADVVDRKCWSGMNRSFLPREAMLSVVYAIVRSNFAMIFGIRKLESWGYCAALFA